MLTDLKCSAPGAGAVCQKQSGQLIPFINQLDCPARIATNGTDILVSELGGRVRIAKASPAAGNQVVFSAASDSVPLGVAIDATHAYFIEILGGSSGTLWRYDLATGETRPLFSGLAGPPIELVSHGAHLYWSTQSGVSVRGVRK
jgi:hypothetical protein